MLLVVNETPHVTRPVRVVERPLAVAPAVVKSTHVRVRVRAEPNTRGFVLRIRIHVVIRFRLRRILFLIIVAR